MALSLKDQLQNMWIENNANVIEQAHSALEKNLEAQSIIQRTFLRMGLITFLVFAVWYLILYLIKAQTISLVQYAPLFWISMIGGIILIFVISFLWQKMNYVTLASLAILFALLQWVGLTGVLYTYSAASIINAFAGAWILFVIMALYGYFTKSDLTKLWPILLIWLIAVIVLSLANIFLIKSSTLDLALSVITLIVFLWLVAWNLQVLKLVALSQDRRLEIVFWISLYLDFINIFLALLRLFGNSRE